MQYIFLIATRKVSKVGNIVQQNTSFRFALHIQLKSLFALNCFQGDK